MNIQSIVLVIILSLFFPLSSSSVENYTQYGKASWYGGKFHGRKTASGVRFNKHSYTAAHKKLPFGTIIKVINVRNGKDVYVRIIDRGPFVKGRIVDISRAAAEAIGLKKRGVARVRLEVVSLP